MLRRIYKITGRLFNICVEIHFISNYLSPKVSFEFQTLFVNTIGNSCFTAVQGQRVAALALLNRINLFSESAHKTLITI